MKSVARALYRRYRSLLYRKGILPLTEPGLSNDLLVPQVQYLIEKYGIDTIVDVGANRGQFAGRMKAHVGFKGSIHCFEPDKRQLQFLNALRAKEGNIFIHNFALGSKPGVLTMNMAAISTLNSFLDVPEVGVDVGQHALVGREEVEVRTLDQFLADLPEAKRVLLKLDTQGYDLEIFAGLRDMLGKVSVVLIEVAFQKIYENAPTSVDVFSALEENGFVFCGMPSANVAHDVVIDSDCLFIAKSLIEGLDMNRVAN